ncbi:MAG TPA: DUF2891 domain-containing protein [Bryobacteraceae bacterium]|nr:DUF2891 domain-containing protein [Bryobacteraceae bacterium]
MNLRLDATQAARFARLALDCVRREYPNKIAHVLTSAADVRAPRHLTPAFYGCFDWHSAVHGHWLLARVARWFPKEPFAAEARAALERNITDINIAGETAYLSAPGRAGFERPYGLAWLLALAAEIRSFDPVLAEAILPLETLAVDHLSGWLPKLSRPDRSGQHSNTAFALGLSLDYARVAGNSDFTNLLVSRARDFYLADRDAPVGWEHSGEDFLSPSLAEADVMRRVLAREEFALWLEAFLPDVRAFVPQTPADRSDGKLAHLDGLNLSRAWMLLGISGKFRELAEAHALQGLAAVGSEHYEGAHWLGTFAVYLLTQAL